MFSKTNLFPGIELAAKKKQKNNKKTNEKYRWLLPLSVEDDGTLRLLKLG
jgi:hypothetical protein